jgi:hypothetical protein
MEKLEEEIKKHVRDGKINCREALELAENLGVKPIEIGRKLDEMKIRIKGCQLGCFK